MDVSAVVTEIAAISTPVLAVGGAILAVVAGTIVFNYIRRVMR